MLDNPMMYIHCQAVIPDPIGEDTEVYVIYLNRGGPVEAVASAIFFATDQVLIEGIGEPLGAMDVAYLHGLVLEYRRSLN